MKAEGTHLDENIESENLLPFLRSIINAKSMDVSLVRQKVLPFVGSLRTNHYHYNFLLRRRYEPESNLNISEALTNGPIVCFLAGFGLLLMAAALIITKLQIFLLS